MLDGYHASEFIRLNASSVFFGGSFNFDGEVSFNDNVVPFSVASTTTVTNLSADMLDGYHASSTSQGDTVAVRGSSGDLVARQYQSTAPIGTAPFSVNSTTVVTNLNADTVDGYHAVQMIAPMATTSGTSSSLVASFNPAFTKTNNRAVRVKMHTTTTGSPTLNANGTGASPVRKPDGTAATLISGGVYTLVWDSVATAFILQGEGGDNAKFQKFVYLTGVSPHTSLSKSLAYSFQISDDSLVGKNRDNLVLNFKLDNGVIIARENPMPASGNRQHINVGNMTMAVTNHTATQPDFKITVGEGLFDITGYCRISSISGNTAYVDMWFDIVGDGQFTAWNSQTIFGYIHET
jgi:hypothetical protein